MNIFVKLLLCLGITGAFKILAISKLVEPSVLALWRKKQKRHPRFMKHPVVQVGYASKNYD